MNESDRTLEELVELARHHKMTPEELDEQRISFAFGNVSFGNPRVTREMVAEQASLLRAK